MRRGGTTYNYHFDGRGNTTYLTDQAGQKTDAYTYDPFGTPRTATGSTENPYRYGGQHGYQYNEATDDYDVRARVYQPKRGRWLSKDPLRFGDGVNLYVYAGNQPADWADPTGISSIASASFSRLSQPPALTGIATCLLVARVLCEDECSPVGKMRNKGPVSFTLWPAVHGNPNAAAAAAAIAKYTALIAKLITKLPGAKPAKKFSKVYTDAIDAVLRVSKKLRERLAKHGVAIYVKVGAQCCTEESCYFFFSENRWTRKESDWIRCVERGRGRAVGFSATDKAGMAKALKTCFERELRNFKCQ